MPLYVIPVITSEAFVVSEMIVMQKRLEFNNSTLQSLFDEREFKRFSGIIRETAQDFPEIQGVLITGSLVQYVRLPNRQNGYKLNSMQKAYEDIVCRSRRKFFPHLDSDLDIWLLIDDIKGNDFVPKELDDKALELIDWYAKQKTLDLKEWIDKKHEAFDVFYKQVLLYPKSWTKKNEIPYYGWGFKETLVDNIGCGLKPVRDRIKGFFSKNYPRDFLEVRAFPSSVFNLRPEKITLDDGEVDRTPFPYYMKDWLDSERNCVVLYRRKDNKEAIYPFDEGGVVLGQRVADEIGWDYRHVVYSMNKRTGVRGA